MRPGVDYAGYEMTPEDLREWVSQSMRTGAKVDRPIWRFKIPEPK